MLFIISDTHFGDRGPRDNFIIGDREKRFLKFLDYVDDNKGSLLILGDLFEWWQVNLSRSVLAYRNLLERLSYVGLNGARWIVGNHDNALTEFIGLNKDYELRDTAPGISLPSINLPLAPSHAYEININGKKYAFLHGHEADSYCRDMNPGVGEITAIMSGLLEDKNKKPVHNGFAVEDVFISSLEAPLNLWRRLTRQAKRRDEMITNVEAYRKDKQADVVVYGHTHEAGNIGDYHFNTGCWCRDRDTFARIDDTNNDTNDVTLWEWDGEKPIPFDHQL